MKTKQKKLISWLLLVMTIFTFIQVNPVKVKAAYFSISPVVNGKSYSTSGICYSQTSHVTINLYTDTSDPTVWVKDVEIEHPGSFYPLTDTFPDGTRNTNGYQYDFDGYGMYIIKVYAVDSSAPGSAKLYQQVSVDVQQANTPTYTTQFTTQNMVVTEAGGKQTYQQIELAGSDTIPDGFRNTIAGWLGSDGKPLIPKDGRDYTLNGYGLMRVYKDNGASGDTQAYPLDSRSGDDYTTFMSYGFDAVSGNIFKQRANMSLVYTAPFPGALAVQTFPDGLPGQTVRMENSFNNENYNIFRNTNLKVDVSTLPYRDDGSVLDTNVYKLDLSRSKIFYGKGDGPWSIVSPQSVSLLDSEKSGFSRTLDFNNYVYRVDLYYTKEPDQPVSGRFGLKAEPKGKLIDSTSITDTASVTMDVKQSVDTEKTWEAYIEGKGLQNNLSIAVGLTRDVAGANFGTSYTLPPDGAYHSISYDKLKEYIKNGTPLAYNDSISNYPISPDQTIKFNYTGTVKVKIGTTELNLTPDPGTDYASFHRKAAGVSYISSPRVYSEIKEGSPLNETFEAMAGVPTTRNLYFASGGSEFIVDFEAEYKSDGTATRNYKSEFTSVDCGWAMDVITGGWQNDSPPPAPPPRTKTDSSGATFTESVHMESGTYIHHYTNPPPPGTPSPVYYPKYRWIQDGHPHHQVGGYSDSWSQTVTYDYMKIKKAKVWKIERSKVNGMTTLVSTNEVTANIVQGDPNIFYNIAQSETSAGGRLRYSLETNQHDSVYWNEGSSDDAHGNTPAGGAVNENQKFNDRRAMTTNVTAVSDFLILQTSSGDQSVLYFQKTSPDAKVTDALTVPKTSQADMWDNNGLSAAKWTATTINMGSYNGNYASPSSKYSTGGGAQIPTIFDSMPAGLNRPGRPGAPLRIFQAALDIPDTLRNGEYITGSSSVFYRNILNYGSGTAAYDVGWDSVYADNGQHFTSPYSPAHTKVNDIVVHDPVSVENAMIMPLDSSRDQRSPESPTGGNLQPAEVETEKVLDPNHPKQNLLFNGDCEEPDSKGMPLGWSRGEWGAENVYSHTVRVNDPLWTLAGSRTFEIRSVAGEPAGSSASYYKDLTTIPMTGHYTLKGSLEAHRCQVTAEVFFFDDKGNVIGGNTLYTTVNTGTPQNFATNFDIPAGTAKLRVELRKSTTLGGYSDSYLFADSLELNNNDVTTWIPYDPVYEYVVSDHPIVTVPVNVDQTFSYTGSVQYFTAPGDGVYTFEVWGAQGGATAYGPNPSALGGYSKGTITLTQGQVVAIYVGGSPYDANYVVGTGTNSTHPGGWNGGGAGDGAFGGGGGATDIRVNGEALNNRVIVAGGGGGGGGEGTYFGGVGGGTSGTTGTYGGPSYPGTGGTQTSGGTNNPSPASYPNGQGKLGQGGSYDGSMPSEDIGGGGGGYYGGAAGFGEAATGGGGSGYIGGVTNGVMQSGVQASHGRARITATGVLSATASGTGQSATFNYTGNAQTFVAAYDGTYTIDMYGAQGGNGAGGHGGYSKGEVHLTAGQTLYVYVGGSNGYNGGGTSPNPGSVGGGASDVRTSTNDLYSRIIVAGGGGGNGTNSRVNGGDAGGATGSNGGQLCGSPGGGGTQTAGGWGYQTGSFGQGGAGDPHPYGGNGGGGWYGGGGGYTDYPGYYDPDDSGGGGGSGYIGGVTNGTTSNSTHTGNGIVTITGQPVPQVPTVQKILAQTQPPSGPPDSWYKLVTTVVSDKNKIAPIPNLGNVSAGNFIDMDYQFYVYFPNDGSFYGNGALGIGATTSERGKGYTSPMDTTEWTKSKSVTFAFNVIYNGKAYKAGTEIQLPLVVPGYIYEFYCVLSNYEAMSAKYTFKAIAINNTANSIDNDKVTNRLRAANLAAPHSAIKNMNVDVLGRIGNLAIEDTEDFRFANFFKKPTTDGEWLVDHVVYKVDITKQNKIFGSLYDLRGYPVSNATNFLNTYGSLSHLSQNPVPFPISPEKNNITALRKQPLRVGYNVFGDLQTIGNYYNNLTMQMYYYALDLGTGQLTPVDVYMNVDNQYKPINLFGNTDLSKVYNYEYGFDWFNERGRRNISSSEATLATMIGSAYGVGSPEDSYHAMGNAQRITLNQFERTFMGSQWTYGQDKNPGKVFSQGLFNVQGQRWHFTFGLPSSAVAVAQGAAASDVNINAMKSPDKVILATADIKAIGNKYSLWYRPQEGNGSIQIGSSNTINLNSIPHTVLAVFSSHKSAADDLEIIGTH